MLCLSCGDGSWLTVSFLRSLGRWQTLVGCPNPCAGATQSPYLVLTGILCLEAGNEPTAPLAQHNAVAGRLWFRQEWTATPGSHNQPYVNPFVRGRRPPRWLRISSTVGGQRPVTRIVEKQLRWPANLTGFRRPAATVFVLVSSSQLVACRRAVVQAVVPLASRRWEALPAGWPVGRWSESGPASVSLLTPAALGVLKARRAGLLSGMGLPWFTRSSASGRPAVASSCSLGNFSAE